MVNIYSAFIHCESINVNVLHFLNLQTNFLSPTPPTPLGMWLDVGSDCWILEENVHTYSTVVFSLKHEGETNFTIYPIYFLQYKPSEHDIGPSILSILCLMCRKGKGASITITPLLPIRMMTQNTFQISPSLQNMWYLYIFRPCNAHVSCWCFDFATAKTAQTAEGVCCTCCRATKCDVVCSCLPLGAQLPEKEKPHVQCTHSCWLQKH